MHVIKMPKYTVMDFYYQIAYKIQSFHFFVPKSSPIKKACTFH